VAWQRDSLTYCERLKMNVEWTGRERVFRNALSLFRLFLLGIGRDGKTLHDTGVTPVVEK